MTNKVYVTDNNFNKNISSIYVGVNGKAKKVLKGYVGVNGKAKLFYNSSPSYLQNYTKREYITSTGGAYIVTDIYGKYTYDFKYSLSNYNITTEQQKSNCIFNMTSQFSDPQTVLSVNMNEVKYSDNTETFNSDHNSNNNPIRLLYNIADGSSSHSFYAINESINSTQSFFFQENNSISIFNNNYLTLFGLTFLQEDSSFLTIASPGTKTLYYFKVYTDNTRQTLAANFIPCTRNQDGIPGLYDTISGKFYTNANTVGNLVAGPEIS